GGAEAGARSCLGGLRVRLGRRSRRLRSRRRRDPHPGGAGRRHRGRRPARRTASASHRSPNRPGSRPMSDLPLDEFETSTALTPIGESEEDKTAADLAPVFDVPVNISAVLGKAHLSVAQLLKLGAGSILELDRKVGEAIDIYVNNRLVARGEVVLVDERL